MSDQDESEPLHRSEAAPTIGAERFCKHWVKWAKDGKIRAIRLGNGNTSGHRYNEDDLRVHLGIKALPGETKKRDTVL